MVTASHNPAPDNGFKCFTRAGTKLAAEDEAGFEANMRDWVSGNVAEQGLGRVREADQDARNLLLDHWLSGIPVGSLKGLCVALDTAFGASAALVRGVFEEAGAKCPLVLGEGEGVINSGVGANNPQTLAKAMREAGCDLGFCFDGDADRCVLISAEGNIIRGDQLIGAIALHQDRVSSSKGPVIVTEQSNSGLDVSLAEADIEVRRCGVGDRNVSTMMAELGAGFGGEESGHLVFADQLPTGDGPGAALRIAAMYAHDPKAWREAISSIHLRPSISAALAAPRKPPLDSDGVFAQQVARVREELHNGGRLLLRYSGTEPVLRVTIEADDTERAQSLVGCLADAWRMQTGFGEPG